MNNPKWKIDKNPYTKHFTERFNQMLTLLDGASMISESGKPIYELCANLQREIRAWSSALHNIEWYEEEESQE